MDGQQMQSSPKHRGRQRSGRAALLWAVLMVGLMIGQAASAQGLAEPPAGLHGMLLLGAQGKIYLTHLAMRTHATHQFQLIMVTELTRGPLTVIGDRTFVGPDLSLDTVSPSQVYFRDRTHPDNHTATYTFVPAERFVLTEVPQGKRDTIRGKVVRGHFEQNPNAPVVLRDVEAKITQILYFQDLRLPIAEMPHPLHAGKLDFLLFGAEGEYFVSHQITLHGETEAPDNNGFHQEFLVNASMAERLNFDVARRAVPLEIDGAHATPEGRLPKQGGTFAARLKGLVNGVEVLLPLHIDLEPEHYLEVLM